VIKLLFADMKNIDLEKIEDKKLVVEYLSGRENILPVLINKYLKLVYRFIFGLVGEESVAEDLTQDVFIKVWKKLKSYNNKYSFKTWLFTIARNTAFDYLRKKKEIVFSEFENEAGDNILIDTLADDTPLAEEALARVEDIKIFTEALKKIPIIYKEVLILRYTNDLSLEEISEILKRPIETVKSQHRRGLLHLKEVLIRII
jgi:RNA polymerase sigma factor (sigma-70 family)